MTINEILEYVKKTPENSNIRVLEDMLNQLDNSSTTPSKLIMNETYAGYESTIKANMSPYEIIGIFADGAESIPTEYISINSSTGQVMTNDPNAYLTTNGNLDSYTLTYNLEYDGNTFVNYATIFVRNPYDGTYNYIKDKNALYVYYD